ncbi:MAG: DUF2939 domain-containing protein [Hyphomicrobium sp.]|nr:DUF2939 domain-containing protein [Hyphomicrobium sp.]
MLRAILTFPLRYSIWVVPFLLYAASPLVAAVVLKEAIKAGNALYVERAIDWEPVRVTLKSSLKSVALDRPLVEPMQAPSGSTGASEAPVPKRGAWARFKNFVGERAIDTLVNRYANAKGLPTLFNYGQTLKRVTGGELDPPLSLAVLPEKFNELWGRVRYARFVSLTRFEIEVEDKDDPTRRFSGLFELKDWRWQLIRLYFHTDKHPLGDLAAADRAVLAAGR